MAGKLSSACVASTKLFTRGIQAHRVALALPTGNLPAAAKCGVRCLHRRQSAPVRRVPGGLGLGVPGRAADEVRPHQHCIGQPQGACQRAGEERIEVIDPVRQLGGPRPTRAVRAACAPSLPFSASSLRSCPADAARSCCLRAATKIKARPPYPAIGPPTCYFLVAGAGVEPATSGL